MPDFLATALLNLVYVAHGNAWRHLARRALPLCFGPWRLHRRKAIWPAPRRVSPRFIRGVVNCPKLARAMSLPEQQQALLSSGPQESFRWWHGSCKIQDLWLLLNGCFNALVSVSLNPNSI
jgi:hypothetical protein